MMKIMILILVIIQKVLKIQSRGVFLSSKKGILIDKLLKKHGIDYNADFFIKFIKKVLKQGIR